MEKIVFLAFVALLSCNTLAEASEPSNPSSKPSSNPNQELNQKASEAVKDLGANMNKTGAAIKQTMDTAEAKVTEAGKKLREDSKSSKSKSVSGKSATGKSSKTGNQIEAGAKKALGTLEVNADKAEHAVVNTVKSMSRQAVTKSGAVEHK